MCQAFVKRCPNIQTNSQSVESLKIGRVLKHQNVLLNISSGLYLFCGLMEQTVASLSIENSGVIIVTSDFDVLSYQYGPCTVYITITESLTSVSEVNFT